MPFPLRVHSLLLAFDELETLSNAFKAICAGNAKGTRYTRNTAANKVPEQSASTRLTQGLPKCSTGPTLPPHGNRRTYEQSKHQRSGNNPNKIHERHRFGRPRPRAFIFHSHTTSCNNNVAQNVVSWILTLCIICTHNPFYINYITVCAGIPTLRNQLSRLL